MPELTPSSDFIELSQYIANNGVLWTQAAGGNISMKLNTNLWIKSSGKMMSEYLSNDFYTVLDFNKIHTNLINLISQQTVEPNLKTQVSNKEQYSNILSQSRLKENLPKPSMETGFHVLLPKKYVAHFHSLPAIQLCELYFKNPELVSDFIYKHLPESLSSSCFIKYEEPGWPLAKTIKKYDTYSIIFLKNHGVILQSDKNQFLNDYSNLETAFCNYFNISTTIPELTSETIEFLFPDFIIYHNKLNEYLLKNSNGTYSLKPYTPNDLHEVWLAYLWLKKNAVAMSQLSAAEIDCLLKSPSEKERIKQMRKQT